MSTKTLSLSTAIITTPGGRSRQHSTSPREPHSAIRITQTEPISSIRTTVLDSAKRGGSVSRGVFGVSVGVAAIIVVVIIATTALSVTVLLRRRSKKRLSNTTDSVAYNSASGQLSMTKSGTLAEKSEYVSTHQSHIPTISSGGVVNEDNRATLGENMTQNVAYGYVGRNEVECNVAYSATATTTDSEDGVEYI